MANDQQEGRGRRPGSALRGRRSQPREGDNAPRGEDYIELGTVPNQESYTRRRNYWQDLAKEIASKLVEGKELDKFERIVAAEALLACTESIPEKEPRKPGQAPRVDAGDLALHYADLRNNAGWNHARAVRELAEGNEISDQAVEKALKKFGAQALLIVPDPNQTKK